MRPHKSQREIGTCITADEKLKVTQQRSTISTILHDEANAYGDERFYRNSHRTLSDYPLAILYHDENYCVIDKPYDVRMDGDFDITVQKLVASWLSVDEKALKWIHQLDFATSGVLCIGLNRSSTAAASSAFEHRQTKKEYLAVLQGHLKLDDWPLLSSPLPFDFPDLPQYNEITQPNCHHISIINRKLTRKRPANSSVDIHVGSSSGAVSEISASSMNWQDTVMLKNLDICFSAFQSLQNQTDPHYDALQDLLENSIQWKQDYQRLQWLSLAELQRQPKMRKLLRKLLSNCGVELVLLDSSPQSIQQLQHQISDQLKQAIVGVSDEDQLAEGLQDSSNQPESVTNDLAKMSTALSSDEVKVLCRDVFQNKTLSVPFIYHLRQEEDKEQGIECKDCLVVNIPIAEVENDFRMEPGNKGNPGKTSITEVYILDHIMYKGQPVTKVLMKPSTGRRHQLRIHSLCLGHPIVGDYTYNEYHRDCINHLYGEQGLNNESMKINIPTASSSDLLADRMMLHAQRLMIPFPTVGKCSEAFRRSLICKYLERMKQTSETGEFKEFCIESLSEIHTQRILSDIPLIQVEAADPFKVIDSHLTIEL